jgi:iron complex outermembrane recepter protein
MHYYFFEDTLMLLLSSLHARVPVKHTLKPITFAVACILSTSAIAADSNTIDLDTISVTGNPLGVSSDQLAVPVTVLNGAELNLRRASSLGDTLDGIPGVSATHFGPNASRPIIRGLDADRIKIMQNGIGVLDASSLSFDHNVSVDPLVIEQVDVVRGPAALLYGGSAVGGVVNATDNRIPKDKIDGVDGRAETSVGGPNNAHNAAAVVDAGNGQFAVHVDVFNRKTDDLNIRGYAVSDRKNQADGTLQENKGKLLHSGSQSDGAAVGASLTFDNGYIGTSYSALNNQYGLITEDSHINMESSRADIAGEFSELGNIVDRVKFRLAHTDYTHSEIGADGTIATTFNNKGIEGSIEAGHAAIGKLKGVVGYQFSNTDFSALGDEAFVPSVNSKSGAAYIYEELPIPVNENQTHKLTFGARFGHDTVDSKDSSNPDFGPGKNRDFNPNSFALGGIYNINKQWSLASNLSHNERTPSYFELYAHGNHAGTSQFEYGNANLEIERANGVDAQVRWKNGGNSFNISTYYTRFANYIGLFNSGLQKLNADGELQDISNFIAVPATFKGIEGEAKFALSDSYKLVTHGDYVDAKNNNTGEYLPRISPLRLGAGLHYQQDKVSARVDVLHAFKQDNVAQNELATDAYTNLSASLSYQLPIKYHVEIFAKANNLLNQEIRDSTSFLKDLAPAGERSVLIGARADF